MGNTQVGKLHKNRVVKDLNGNIIDWFDEAGAGWIVRGRQIVNTEAWNAHVAKQKDKMEAAKAAANPKIRQDYPEQKDGQTEASKVDRLEHELAEMKEMLKKALEK
jgi:uncharacterized protein (DUF4415 family)